MLLKCIFLILKIITLMTTRHELKGSLNVNWRVLVYHVHKLLTFYLCIKTFKNMQSIDI